jgi:hypothetical protein
MAADEFSEKLCDVKHKNVDKDMQKMAEDINKVADITRDSINGLHKKINWFYVLTIATLAATLFDVIKGRTN